MADNAGPDIALISANFTDLLDVLPGLMQDMQPLASGLLGVTDAGLKVVGFLEKMKVLLPIITAGIGAFLGGPVGAVIGAVVGIGVEVAGTSSHFAALDHTIADVRSRTKAYAVAAAAAKPPVFDLGVAVGVLTAAMQKNVTEILTLQGDEIGWRQSLQAATKQLDSNSAGLRGNSKDALANKAAVLQTSQSVLKFYQSRKNGADADAGSRHQSELQTH